MASTDKVKVFGEKKVISTCIYLNLKAKVKAKITFFSKFYQFSWVYYSKKENYPDQIIEIYAFLDTALNFLSCRHENSKTSIKFFWMSIDVLFQVCGYHQWVDVSLRKQPYLTLKNFYQLLKIFCHTVMKTLDNVLVSEKNWFSSLKLLF